MSDTTVTNRATPAGTVTAVATGAMLDRWAGRDWRDGLRISDLHPLDRLTVLTLNSTYEIVIMAPGSAEVIVRGGAFFPTFTRARLAGSSLGGSFLKLHSVHVGFRLELVCDSQAQSVVTSVVQEFAIAPHTADDVM
jgi:hypothetical protein